MTTTDRIDAFAEAGKQINNCLNTFFDDDNSEFMQVLLKAQQLNHWFTLENQKLALLHMASLLSKPALQHWIDQYPYLKENNRKSKTIGVIMAGNLPMVGFHDLLCVLLSGNKLQAKLSSTDQVLIPYFCKLLITVDPAFAEQIYFTEKIANMDAVIATGSNNSARYFEYYFGKYPHLIRKNRNAVAVLTGKETKEDLQNLGKDIFSYFGLGCRNVSKLYVPEGYIFDPFFVAMEKYASLMEHNKYMNNFDYNSAVLLLKKVPFLTNNFLIIVEDKSFSTPVAMLHYEFYKNAETLNNDLAGHASELQCIIGHKEINKNCIAFGESQKPGLMDYADGVDVLKFLGTLY